MINSESPPLTSYQVVKFQVLTEEGFSLFLLVADKVFDVHIKAGRGDAVRAQCGLLTLLKQQGQQRKQGMPVGGQNHKTMLAILIKSIQSD